MRTVIVRIGTTGAGALLALGLLAGPSAAKGSDKQSSDEKVRESNKVTCFQPEGKTQGRSFSDPDGDTNGGADKPSPACTGGVDKSDRDGNNGCGNDIDREDDNNGNCGGGNGQGSGTEPPQGQGPGNGPAQQVDGNDVTVETETDEGDVSVQGAGLESNSGTPATEGSSTSTDPAAVAAAADTTPAETQVLGETLFAPDNLPRTGAGIGGLALLGGLLVGGGRLTVLARKLLRIG